MKTVIQILEFNKILERLSEHAISSLAKQKLLALEMILDEKLCALKMQETTFARKIIDSVGMPPISSMQFMEEIIKSVTIGTMLDPEHLLLVASFIKGCQNMKRYLQRAEYLDCDLAYYGRGFCDLEVLKDLIELSIRNNEVDSEASVSLKKIRRSIEGKKELIKQRVEKVMQAKKAYLADYYILQREGRYVLAVKKEWKNQVNGSVLDTSRSGNTVFIEPSSVSKVQEELQLLEIEEDQEVRKVLYSLTNEVENFLAEIKINMEMMEALDIAFAKGKLSVEMKACSVPVTSNGKLVIKQGKHPLLDQNTCVPLNLGMKEGIRGIIVTGPNTGGKTVTLKTVGLLSMMAQCGLHVPVAEGSSFVMRNQILCDIGDGQSIEQNLSTFSAHITNMIDILKKATEESLVLLDELGSGTDPAEGMGIAIATLEALRNKRSMIVATTHYPEVKDYAAKAEGYINARMAFDKESLKPLYELQIGEAGESCAFYIAERLGFPKQLIALAHTYTYAERRKETLINHGVEIKRQEEICKANQLKNVKEIKERKTRKTSYESKTKVSGTGLKTEDETKITVPKIKKEVIKQKLASKISFEIGDSVSVDSEKGIVFAKLNEEGKVGVQIKGIKKWVIYKKVKLLVKASELYPEGYDFSIIFDSVANRKAKHQMQKGYRPQETATYETVNEAQWSENH